IKPRADEVLEIRPLIPEKKWQWFALRNISYHGKTISLIWDKTGEKYHRGKGFHVYVDGRKVLTKKDLKPVTYNMSNLK
ncbi:MAG: glycoside hydrolase, partial [Pedobacter sp.]|nr:glycoside hydrolase [Pedobacter sp.]